MCHAEERYRPFAALISRQATKRLVHTTPHSFLTQRRKGARGVKLRSTANKEKPTNENNELLGLTELIRG